MTDLEIANKATLKPIVEIASKLGIDADELELYGKYKAKLPLKYSKMESKSKLILVTATSPTPSGEGKTTVSIGLTQALCQKGKLATAVLREPSLGPVFGMKGGATGGGFSQVLPMEDINLHFTGDFSAIEKAHNLLSAMIDNNIQNKKNNLGIDARTVIWKRVIDLNDRTLRNVVIGLGGTTSGTPRETGFDITAASEVMAILCMSTDMQDLKRRLGNIFIGYTYDKRPVYARDIKAEGAMATLLKDAIKPNLVQTIEGTPAIIHGGPFANIAQGTNTIIGTKTAMALSDYTVTEAGFGADLGAEKFLDIKCRAANLRPDAVVIVTTIRALKYHGGMPLKELQTPDVEALKRGIPNLEKHIENVKLYNLPVVVAINRFVSDTDEEIETVYNHCQANGVECAKADIWANGGAGGAELADKVVAAVESGVANFQPIYNLESTHEEKIATIAKLICGADGVKYAPKALNKLKIIKELGLDNLSICMAKTQKSLSDDPKLLGRPTGFNILIRDIEIASGAGFIIPIAGDIMRMPGLPEHPTAELIDIDEDGKITGLF
ncbi:MAG: formate--tetrahydrofolate ligase [bacterium]